MKKTIITLAIHRIIKSFIFTLANLLIITSFFVAILFFSFNAKGQGGIYINDTTGQVSITPNNAASASSAMLDVVSTTKGLLIPRMTTAQRNSISSPATGLLIYNTTTNAYDFYNGGWKTLETSGSSWSITGNSGLADGTNFIGNTDNVPFTIRVNNQKAGRISSADNLFLGYLAGANSNVAVTDNIAIGDSALYTQSYATPFSSGNVAIGNSALFMNNPTTTATGRYNTAVGNQALRNNTTGDKNTANGNGVLYSNTTGYHNTANGYQSLYSNTFGNYNTANGVQSLYSNNGSANTANGYQALYSNSTGTNNTASGLMSLYSSTLGHNNTAFGYGALYASTTGDDNTANGYQALRFNTTGSNNAALGMLAGFGASGMDFNLCTFVGASSYPTVSRTNVTMLGYGIVNAQCTGDDQVLLGNTSVTSIRAQVSSITAYSDARFKKNIKDDVKGLDFIMKLSPVTYNEDPTILHKIWGTPDSIVSKIDHSQIQRQRFIGFLAQDVEKAAKESGFDFPGIDIPKNEKEAYSLRYCDFIMPMVKAMQEQQAEIDELKKEKNNLSAENKQMKEEIGNMKSEIAEIKSLLDVSANK